MQLKETDNVHPLQVLVDSAGPDWDATLQLKYQLNSISLDQETAQQLLPILEHFIKTGELPDAS